MLFSSGDVNGWNNRPENNWIRTSVHHLRKGSEFVYLGSTEPFVLAELTGGGCRRVLVRSHGEDLSPVVFRNGQQAVDNLGT